MSSTLNDFKRSEPNVNKTLAAVERIKAFDFEKENFVEFQRLCNSIFKFIPGNTHLLEINILEKKTIEFYNKSREKGETASSFYLILSFLNFKTDFTALCKETILEHLPKIKEGREDFFYAENTFAETVEFCRNRFLDPEVQDCEELKQIWFLIINAKNKVILFPENILENPFLLLFSYLKSENFFVKENFLRQILQLEATEIELLFFDERVSIRDFSAVELRKFNFEFTKSVLAEQRDHQLLALVFEDDTVARFCSAFEDPILGSYCPATIEDTRAVLAVIERMNEKFYVRILKNLIIRKQEDRLFPLLLNKSASIDCLYLECCIIGKKHFVKISEKTAAELLRSKYVNILLRDFAIFKILSNKVKLFKKRADLVQKLYENFEKKSILSYLERVDNLLHNFCSEGERTIILEKIILDKEFLLGNIADIDCDTLGGGYGGGNNSYGGGNNSYGGGNNSYGGGSNSYGGNNSNSIGGNSNNGNSNNTYINTSNTNSNNSSNNTYINTSNTNNTNITIANITNTTNNTTNIDQESIDKKKKRLFTGIIEKLQDHPRVQQLIPSFFKCNQDLFLELVFSKKNKKITTFVFEGLRFLFENFKKIQNLKKFFRFFYQSEFLKEENQGFWNTVLLKNLGVSKAVKHRVLQKELEKICSENAVGNSIFDIFLSDFGRLSLRKESTSAPDTSSPSDSKKKFHDNLSPECSLRLKKSSTHTADSCPPVSPPPPEPDVEQEKIWHILKFYRSSEVIKMFKNELVKEEKDVDLVIRFSSFLSSVNRHKSGLALNNSLIELGVQAKSFAFFATMINYGEAPCRDILTIVGRKSSVTLMSIKSVLYVEHKGLYSTFSTDFLDKLKKLDSKMEITLKYRQGRLKIFVNDSMKSYEIKDVVALRIGEKFLGIARNILFFENMEIKQDYLFEMYKKGSYVNYLEKIEKKCQHDNYRGVFIKNLKPRFLSNNAMDLKFENVYTNKSVKWMKNNDLIKSIFMVVGERPEILNIIESHLNS